MKSHNFGHSHKQLKKTLSQWTTTQEPQLFASRSRPQITRKNKLQEYKEIRQKLQKYSSLIFEFFFTSFFWYVTVLLLWWVWGFCRFEWRFGYYLWWRVCGVGWKVNLKCELAEFFPLCMCFFGLCLFVFFFFFLLWVWFIGEWKEFFFSGEN